jgi:hypothetical protein
MDGIWRGDGRQMEGSTAAQVTFFLYNFILVFKLGKANDFQAIGSENRIRCPSFRKRNKQCEKIS